MKTSMEHRWNDNDRVKTEALGENRVPVLLCPPKIKNENPDLPPASNHLTHSTTLKANTKLLQGKLCASTVKTKSCMLHASFMAVWFQSEEISK